MPMARSSRRRIAHMEAAMAGPAEAANSAVERAVVARSEVKEADVRAVLARAEVKEADVRVVAAMGVEEAADATVEAAMAGPAEAAGSAVERAVVARSEVKEADVRVVADMAEMAADSWMAPAVTRVAEVAASHVAFSLRTSRLCAASFDRATALVIAAALRLAPLACPAVRWCSLASARAWRWRPASACFSRPPSSVTSSSAGVVVERRGISRRGMDGSEYGHAKNKNAGFDVRTHERREGGGGTGGSWFDLTGGVRYAKPRV
jgi:hypothetical protein